MHLEAMIPVTVPMAFAIIAGICICTIFLMILGGLFAPTVRYRVCSTEPLQNDSGHFFSLLEALTDAKANWHSSFEVLTNGDRFYETELAAIGAAQKNVNLEAYIFDRGEIGGRYVEALAERARAGVNVNVICDAFGSFGITANYFADLIRAGGKVAWSNGLRWDRIARIDNRNHRHLQATFAATWLEACGDVLASQHFFQADEQAPEDAVGIIVNSTPTSGGSTRARILFQTLIASATKTIHISTPYFLPDKTLTEELIRAITDRGIQIRIIVPSKKSDHMLTRSASRRGYGPLLKAGAQVYEYQPS